MQPSTLLASASALALVLLAACGSTDASNREGGGQAAVQSRAPIHHPQYGLITAQPVEGWEVYGADVPAGKAVPLADLVANVDAYRGKEVVVEAPIQAACLVKGCWMMFDADGEPMRVKFKDYAFFVPKDSAGRTARVHARFEVKEMSAEQVKHYLEDEGKHDEAALVTGPVQEFTLYATGVRIKE